MKALLTLCITGAALLAQAPAPTKAAPKTGTATKTGAPAAPRANPLLNPATLKAIAPAQYEVKVVTTHGDFTVLVHRDWSPLGADRFYNLVRNRFFSDAPFFRWVPNFVVQFGLTGNPAVNAAWEKAVIKDDPVKHPNTKGTLVFATAGPGTRTTQLFINLKDNTPLDSQGFSPFGEVTAGMDIVQGLYPGYGEQPDQQAITTQGNTYLNAKFPKMDRIKTATVVPAAAAPGAAPTKTGAPAPAAKKADTPAAPPKK